MTIRLVLINPPMVHDCPALHSRQNFAWDGFSCWHRGHFIAYSPRAGRGSGLATIARGAIAGQQREPGLASTSIAASSPPPPSQPVRHAHVAVNRCGGGEMFLRLLALARGPGELAGPSWQCATRAACVHVMASSQYLTAALSQGSHYAAIRAQKCTARPGSHTP